MAHTDTTSWAPWKVLLHWSPFHIDALGLVTLLGAEEVNAAVGRLVSSAYLEYLPLLGAYVIAGNRFTEKAAGFNLYNISQGIHTTDLAAWLTRWMLSQQFETTRNFVVWTVTPPISRKNEITFSVVISVALNGFLVAGTILSKDWYGFANAIAMIVSIIIRAYVIGQQRIAFDAMVDKVINTTKPEGNTYEAKRYAWELSKQERKHEKKSNVRSRVTASASQEAQSSGSNSSTPSSGPKQSTQNVQSMNRPTRPNPKDYDKKTEVWNGTPTKVLIIQSDSKAVTFWMPNELLFAPSVFIEGPVILNPKTYFAVRSIGWLAFAVHIVAIGMADLASQMYTVALMVLPTILLIAKVGCDDSEWFTNFEAWVRGKLHGQNVKSKRQEDAEKGAKPTEFRKVRQCWVGSRLRAEIYEWPESYEFHEEGKDKDKKWVSGRKEGQERSKKRQDLYAWLALTTDEEESMDKWDLFPHIRKGNTSWWQTYKLKKATLKGDKRDSMGPQDPLDTSPPPSQQQRRPPPQTQPGKPPATNTTNTAAAAPHSSPPENRPRSFQMPGRTATFHFIDATAGPQTSRQTKAERRQSSSVTMGSSAFPAISDHDQIEADEGEQVHTDDAETQTLGDPTAEPGISDDNTAAEGLPPITTQLPSTPRPDHDAAAGTSTAASASPHVLPSSGSLTQSPITTTTAAATTDSPQHNEKRA
ncbi:hypothetical protein Z517_03195 [Fonsecaea pedrosoi CBS 271.37]|uniref:Uncharacterized protein n=1 Tax=Fonsecaea pedrosoi CBS 271.37 TaxID=1442368 RepID=A0A0D2HHP6_9EURO|nr:uncharacterized protein Z517_03195 [Fonsecaea pedrosoi CBS 271.37]KIW83949.1 hypothetical protein Z517_03195 [Fonsecaea pedrosoi CBS 271.37]